MKPVKVSDDVWMNPDRVVAFEPKPVAANGTIITCIGRPTVHVQSNWSVTRVAFALGWTGDE